MSTEELPDPPLTIRGPTSIEVGQEGQWEATNPPSGTTDYRWDMGDGTTETTSVRTVNNTYSSPGDITIRCRALENGTSWREAHTLFQSLTTIMEEGENPQSLRMTPIWK